MLSHSIMSGFIGAVILSFFMIMKAEAGLVPELNPINDLGVLANQLTGVSNVYVGWILHFCVGSLIWGPLFGVTLARCSLRVLLKGMLFGFLVFFIVGLGALVSHGSFVSASLKPLILATLILHLIFSILVSMSYRLISHYRYLSE